MATNVKMYADLYSTRKSTLTPTSTILSVIEGETKAETQKTRYG